KAMAAKRERTAAQHAADLDLRKSNEAHRNQMAAAQRTADIETAKLNLESKLRKDELAAQNAAEKERRAIDNAANREAAEINAEIRRWNAEIDKMIMEEEDARRDKLVESIKRYQIDLANASRDIVESIGHMSLELREKASTMILEKTKEYKKLQDEAHKDSMLRSREVMDLFLDVDKDMCMMMLSTIKDERSSMFDMAGRFINELSEDMKRLNANTDELMRMGMDNVNAYLRPMSNALGINTDLTIKQLQ
ncbi:MAG: hypothetical protein IJ265_03905, partial [Oscillospiraceae bacterium]|nr:hypothetical protein [Oscillospiraceae bacterium]